MTEVLTAGAPLVGLFVTCLVDLIRPSIGFAAIKLLEDAGARVEVPLAQTCCGQPAFNSGDRADAQAIARQVVDVFEGFDYVVAPSGSCAGMLKLHYPRLLADDPAYAERAKALAEKSFELTRFLVDVLYVEGVDATYAARVTYHESCSSLRETGSSWAARRLLQSIRASIWWSFQIARLAAALAARSRLNIPAFRRQLARPKRARSRQRRRVAWSPAISVA